jgi:hypothetical protein
MGRRLNLVALAVGGATFGCSGITVQTDYDPGIDFSRYSTFYILEEAGDDTAPGFWDDRIKNSMAKTLTAKGWTQVDSPDEADVAVGYQLTTEERTSYDTVHTGWGGYGYGYGGWYDPYWGGGMSTSTTTERRYEVGTLIIAMFDQEQRQMVYASTGSATIDQRQRTPEESQVRSDEVIDRLLRDFPPAS